MTINVAPATDWQRHNGGQDDPRFNKCSPNLRAIRIEMQHLWDVTDLGCYGERDIRGGGLPSSHSHGAAIDLRYLEQIGRTRFINEVMPWLIANSFELHVSAIHDYIGGRIWHAGRTANVMDAYTAWFKTQAPNGSTGMGQSWAGWVHIETTEAGWFDDTQVLKRVMSYPPTTPIPDPAPPEEDDMARNYVVVGNSDFPGPQRYLDDGISFRLLLDEDDFHDVVKTWGLDPIQHPDPTQALATPRWKTGTWIAARLKPGG